jgi:Ser/Thr protein kinase RdoA (MazF antagonist)
MSVRAAAMAWGVPSEPRLIKDRENAVYEIRLPDGTRAALRLHRAGYQSDAAIRSELWWMSQLADAGLPVPRAVPTLSEDLIANANGRAASVVTWVDGDQFGDGDSPLPGDAALVESRFHALGGLIAGMHDATDALDLPTEFERPRWDGAAFTSDNPLWGRYWENPALAPEEVRDVLAAREVLKASLAGMTRDGADCGLIHADVLRENVLVTEAGLALIDFDDSGFGFRAYDLATALVQGLEDPMYPVARQALEAGYRAARRPDAGPLGNIEMFVALRCFASAGWIVSRAEADDPRMRFYADRAVRAARTVLG